MNRLRWLAPLLPALLLPAVPDAPAQGKPVYAKKGTRAETVLATLKASGLPTLEGTWHYIGPFDNAGNAHFETVYPPEKEIDLKAALRIEQAVAQAEAS